VKPQILSLLLVVFPCSGYGAVLPLSNPLNFGSGSEDSCVFDGTGFQCWGSNYYGQLNLAVLHSPRELSLGGDHACALDEDGVKCWGAKFDPERVQVPTLTKPRQISAGLTHTCALDATGVICWGDNRNGQMEVPLLRHPLLVSSGYFHTCALDDSGVICWGAKGEGDRDHGQTKPPTLQNVKSLGSGNFHSCALTDSEVVCWGDNRYGQTAVPKLQHPTQLTVGGLHSCAIDNAGVKCWGGVNKHGELNVPQIKNPRQVVAGAWHTCATDDLGIHCWGGNTEGQIDIPAHLVVVPDLKWNSIQEYLRYIEKAAPPAKGQYFADLRKFIDSHGPLIDDGSIYLLVAFLNGAVMDVDSAFYRERIVPGFQATLSYLNRTFEYSEISDGLHKIPATSERRLVALASMQSAIFTAQDFLGVSDKAKTLSLLRAIGQAQADPDSVEKLQAVLSLVSDASPALNKLSVNPKSAFLAQTVQLSADWLRGNQ